MSLISTHRGRANLVASADECEIQPETGEVKSVRPLGNVNTAAALRSALITSLGLTLAVSPQKAPAKEIGLADNSQSREGLISSAPQDSSRSMVVKHPDGNVTISPELVAVSLAMKINSQTDPEARATVVDTLRTFMLDSLYRRPIIDLVGQMPIPELDPDIAYEILKPGAASDSTNFIPLLKAVRTSGGPECTAALQTLLPALFLFPTQTPYGQQARELCVSTLAEKDPIAGILAMRSAMNAPLPGTPVDEISQAMETCIRASTKSREDIARLCLGDPSLWSLQPQTNIISSNAIPPQLLAARGHIRQIVSNLYSELGSPAAAQVFLLYFAQGNPNEPSSSAGDTACSNALATLAKAPWLTAQSPFMHEPHFPGPQLNPDSLAASPHTFNRMYWPDLSSASVYMNFQCFGMDKAGADSLDQLGAMFTWQDSSRATTAAHEYRKARLDDRIQLYRYFEKRLHAAYGIALTDNVASQNPEDFEQRLSQSSSPELYPFYPPADSPGGLDKFRDSGLLLLAPTLNLTATNLGNALENHGMKKEDATRAASFIMSSETQRLAIMLYSTVKLARTLNLDIDTLSLSNVDQTYSGLIKSSAASGLPKTTLTHNLNTGKENEQDLNLVLSAKNCRLLSRRIDLEHGLYEETLNLELGNHSSRNVSVTGSIPAFLLPTLAAEPRALDGTGISLIEREIGLKGAKFLARRSEVDYVARAPESSICLFLSEPVSRGMPWTWYSDVLLAQSGFQPSGIPALGNPIVQFPIKPGGLSFYDTLDLPENGITVVQPDISSQATSPYSYSTWYSQVVSTQLHNQATLMWQDRFVSKVKGVIEALPDTQELIEICNCTPVRTMDGSTVYVRGRIDQGPRTNDFRSAVLGNITAITQEADKWRERLQPWDLTPFEASQPASIELVHSIIVSDLSKYCNIYRLRSTSGEVRYARVEGETVLVDTNTLDQVLKAGPATIWRKARPDLASLDSLSTASGVNSSIFETSKRELHYRSLATKPTTAPGDLDGIYLFSPEALAGQVGTIGISHTTPGAMALIQYRNRFNEAASLVNQLTNTPFAPLNPQQQEKIFARIMENWNNFTNKIESSATDSANNLIAEARKPINSYGEIEYWGDPPKQSGFHITATFPF